LVKKKKLAEPKEPMVDPNYIVPTAIGEFLRDFLTRLRLAVGIMDV
jgi:hypothetical protein